MEELSQDYVRSLFDYRDGELYWKSINPKEHRIKIGDRAGTVRKDGYRGVGINRKLYKAHRLIFLWHHGYVPKELDHIDCDKSNNSIDNLREATRQENNRNVGKRKSINGKPTTSKFKGVFWNKQTKKWRSRIMNDGKRKHLGYYTSEIKAALAYDRAATELDGEFATTNKSLGL